MGSTSGGLPWPDPNAFVHQGDDAIRALAEAVDPTINTSWVPTWSGITLGTAGLDAVFSRMGRFCDFSLLLTFTGSTVITGDVTFTLPVTPRATRATFDALLRPNPSAGVYDGSADVFGSPGVVSIRYPGASGLLTALSATAPLSWVTNGYIYVQGRYFTQAGAAALVDEADA